MSLLSRLFKKSDPLPTNDNAEQEDLDELKIKGRDLATQGSYKQALSCFEMVLARQEKLFGKQHPELAATLSDIGFAWDGLNEYRKAIEYYEKALAIRRKVGGSDSHSIAITLNNIGLSWLALDPYKSEKYIEEALVIMRKELGKDHPQTKQTEVHLVSIKKNLPG
jgi:tetratricopeptide (TPR) repeat protein